MPVRLAWDSTHFFTDNRDPCIGETVQQLKTDIAELPPACEPYSVLLKRAATTQSRLRQHLAGDFAAAKRCPKPSDEAVAGVSDSSQ